MEEPVLVKSLKLLRDNSESLTAKEIAVRIKEDQIYVEKALEKLKGRDIVAKIGELYHYQKTTINEEFSQKILAVYDKVIKKPKIELMVRGLLSGQSYPVPMDTSLRVRYIFVGESEGELYLFHFGTLVKILEEEGLDSKEIKSFLEEEIKNGWLGKIEFYLGSREEITWPAPIYISFYPHYFMTMRRMEAYQRIRPEPKDRELVMIYMGKMPSDTSSFISGKIMSAEELEEFKKEFRERWKFIRREDYLIGQYPPELIKPAREYLNNEKPEIKKKISDEAFKFWYGSRSI